MQKQTLIMVLAIFLVIGIGFAIWFQVNNSIQVVPQEEVVSSTPTSTESLATSTPTSTYEMVPAKKPTPKPAHRPGETVDQCIQTELDLGQSDANAIFLKCLPEAATPSN